MKKIGWLIWLILFGVGLIGVWQRLTYGHLLTHYGSFVPWGLWVAAYIYFIGLSAGAFLLSSLVFVFNVKQLEKVGKLALVVALICLLMALFSIWFDLGHMGRFWYVFVYPNFHSMMAWMVWLYSAYFILLVAELYFVYRPASQKREKSLKILGSLGIPLAIIFHGGVGALFAVVGARVYWHSSLFPILFLTGALTSGGALLLAVVAWLWPQRDEGKRKLVKLLAQITLCLILFDLMLEWAEISVPLWCGMAEHTAGLKLMLFGPFWWVFWIAHLLLGAFIPVLILAVKSHDPQWAGLAGFLTAVLFMAVRLNVVIPGLAVPIIHGIDDSIRHPRLTTTYVPSLHEWMVLAFVVSLGIFLFILAKRFARIFDLKEGAGL